VILAVCATANGTTQAKTSFPLEVLAVLNHNLEKATQPINKETARGSDLK